MVAAVFEISEIASDARVLDRIAAGIFCKIGLSNVGTQPPAFMDENMIPGLFAGRLGLIRFIPSVASHTAYVDRHDNAAIAVERVHNNKAKIVMNPRRGTTL